MVCVINNIGQLCSLLVFSDRYATSTALWLYDKSMRVTAMTGKEYLVSCHSLATFCKSVGKQGLWSKSTTKDDEWICQPICRERHFQWNQFSWQPPKNYQCWERLWCLWIKTQFIMRSNTLTMTFPHLIMIDYETYGVHYAYTWVKSVMN